MVDLTARLGPSEQALARAAQAIRRYRAGFGGRQRRNGQAAAGFRRPEHHQRAATWWRARPGARSGLVDAVRAAESALGQARTLLDAVDSAGTDINRAVATLPAAIADIQNGINAGGNATGTGQYRRTPPSSALLATPRSRPSPTRRSIGTADPLGAFTKLTTGRRRTGPAAGQRRRRTRGRRTAQPRVRPSAVHRAVTGTGCVRLHRHPARQHRPGGAHPARRGGAPTAGRAGQAGPTNLNEAIAHANGAAMLAAQAQSIGQCRRSGRAALLHRAVRQQQRVRHGRRASAASSSATSSRRRCAAAWAAAWAAAGARRPSAGHRARPEVAIASAAGSRTLLI